MSSHVEATGRGPIADLENALVPGGVHDIWQGCDLVDGTVSHMTPSRTGSRDTRPISWVGAARKGFEKFPRAQLDILAALTVAADGEKADIARPLKGFGSGVFEVALKYRTNGFRTVYALQLGMDVWVLHAFQKEAKTGIKAPKEELELLRDRLKRLQKSYGNDQAT